MEKYMNREHSKWKEFLDRLEGREGCDFKEKIPGDKNSVTWKCKGGKNKNFAEKILKKMGFDDKQIKKSFNYFESHGGYCDCEILFNVDK